jgi:hypothetical protein
MNTPKLIDYKLLNNDLKLKILNEKLNKSLKKLQGNPEKIVSSLQQSPTPPKPINPINTIRYKPVFYKKTSILFNLVLGGVIIFIPFFLYYRYKNKPSQLDKNKKIIDVVSSINKKIGLNPDYIKDFERKQS